MKREGVLYKPHKKSRNRFVPNNFRFDKKNMQGEICMMMQDDAKKRK
jgi:hypothetical protein